jgi:Beta-xylosidase
MHTSLAPPRLRNIVALAAALTLALAAIVALEHPAAAVTIDTSAWYQLINRNSGKALDVNGASTADGADIIQWSASSTSLNQQWQFVSAGDGYYRLKARHSGKVADVSSASTADGADVIQWSDNGGTNQQWSVIDTGGGYVKFLNRNSGKALDVYAHSTADGADVVQWTDNGGTNQQWQLVQVGTATPTPTPTVTGTPTTPPASYPNPGLVTGSTLVHDPSMLKTSNGYLVAHTGNNIVLKTSADRTAFREAGVAFPNGASWTLSYTGGSANLWAPDVSYHNGKYYMYYAASTFGSQNSAIFLATSTSGTSGTWTNQGLVISTSSSSNFNAIDPNLIVDDSGHWWLSLGSFWTGIKMIPLDSSTGLRSGSTIYSIAQRTGGSTAIEAPFVFKHGSYYYLWVSFDLCCQGASSTYRIMVGRSTSVTGPYVDRNGTAMTSGGGTQVLAGHGGVHGPGGEGVFTDNDGDILVYHYYDDSGTARLGINKIGYDSSGWPFVY